MPAGPTTPLVRAASFSRDRRYRYQLRRVWDDHHPPLVWVMLNPSAADAVGDDPTTRRVVALSRSWGYGACHVVNLFAYRTHQPRALADAADPTGPGNARALRAALRAAGETGVVMVGWGRAPVASLSVGTAAGTALRRIRRAGLRPMAVGVNADGSPRHPLYVPNTARPFDFTGD